MIQNELAHMAAHFIKSSQALIITAGAGMGHDSGLPSFRGNEGFWKEYPMFKDCAMRFVDAANPTFFQQDPHKFWYFYGHRFNLYNSTIPHQGFNDILQIANDPNLFNKNYFIFTSNVDMQFQKAGFDNNKIMECHGNINYYQCNKCDIIEEMPKGEIELDASKYEAVTIPTCKHCKNRVRPNILMFGDSTWLNYRVNEQEQNLYDFIEKNQDKSLTIIECGAGTAIPTVRWQGEYLLNQRKNKTCLIRINTYEQELMNPNNQVLILNESNQNLKNIYQNKSKVLIQFQRPSQISLEQIKNQVYQL